MLDKKINTLLFTHDCVIVPGLGGFVASQAAARHNAVQHTFIPPARVIAFNVYLRQNDGLLANFISTEDKVPFNEAMKIIERYVERCFLELEAGRKVTVTDIGQLYYDNEKNIQFSPDETAFHSLSAFGLTSVRAVPAAREAKKEPLLFSPLRSSVKKEKRKSSTRVGSRLLNTGLVVGVLIWTMFNVYVIAPRNFNLSALNPFEKIDSDRIRPVPDESPKPEEKNTSPAPAVQPLNNRAVLPSEEKVHPENTPQKPKEENSPTVKAIAESSTGHYFTIVGVFSVPANAEKMLTKMRESGYQNCGSFEKENNRTIVYAEQFPHKADAVASLQQLKEHGLDAWILNH